MVTYSYITGLLPLLVLPTSLYFHLAEGLPVSEQHQERLHNTHIFLPDVVLLGLPHSGIHTLLTTLSGVGYKYVPPIEDSDHHITTSDSQPLTHPHGDGEIFTGLPWSLTYAEVAPLLPDAKFILTIRKNENAWLQCLTQSSQMASDREGDGVFQAQMTDQAYLDEYHRYVESVRQFFTSSDDRKVQFLEVVVDADDEEGMLKRHQLRKVCRFLDVDCGRVAEHHHKTELWRRSRLWKLERSIQSWTMRKLVKALQFVGWLTALHL